MYKLFIFSLFITFPVFLSHSLRAQSTPKEGNFYMAIGAGVGMNAWEIKDAQFSMVYYMSPYDYINSIKSVHNQNKAAHIACNIEIGNTHHWFGSMNVQITAGSMVGLNLGIACGLNFPFQINEKLLLVQVGAELSYLNVSKILDTKMLNQAVRLQGKLFNTYYPLTTSLENDDMVFKPFIALRYPIGKYAHLRIMAGHQTILLERTRITFSQKISSSSKSSSRRIATFHTDDTSFDFQYNEQKISHIPFDYSGFFVTMGLAWAF